MTNVQIVRWASLEEHDRTRLMRRAQIDIDEALAVVGPIVDDIRAHGGSAVRRWVHKLDSPEIVDPESVQLEVSAEEIAVARTEVERYDAGRRNGLGLLKAIETAIENVVTYHEDQPRSIDWETEVRHGVTAGERVTPIDSVGIYVPRGKGSFPSVAYMLAVPAYIAGVPEIAICTPPDGGGVADAACLVTAEMVASRFGRLPSIYKIGGAQAIAALAFGAEPIPRVAKVVGPGNEYVTAAKRIVAGHIDTGLPAGPSESLVICDETSDPLIAAHELLVEAEHGPRSSALLLTPDVSFATEVAQHAGKLIDELPEPQRSFCREVFSDYGAVIVTSNHEESLAIANRFAAEHVHLLTRDPRSDMAAVRNAGEILMGECAPIPLGNFCIGLNAVLPTGGFATSYSGVGVHSFQKRTSFAEVTPVGLTALAPVAEAIAEYEGFTAHRLAVEAARRKWSVGEATGKGVNYGHGNS
jgi:histidinol dehydrogenase